MKKLIAITLGVALAFLGTIALASRNSSGTMSAPALNPVTTGSTITIAWANGTINDIVSELSDSLSRSGKGGMLAPIRTTDGTIAAPAHAFTSEPGLGLYRVGAGDLSMAVGGANPQRWGSAATTFPLEIALNKSGAQGITKSGSGNLTISSSVAGGNVIVTPGAGGYVVAGGNVTMGGFLITNLADPVSAQDAATKNYVDVAAALLLPWNGLSITGAGCSGSNGPAYVKYRGIVYFRGVVSSTAGSTCGIATVGAGFRPAGNVSGLFQESLASCTMVAATGVWTCTATTGSTLLSLHGISYPAEQ